MTTAVEEIAPAVANVSPASATGLTSDVRRDPFYLPSRGRSLFAWLHHPPRDHNAAAGTLERHQQGVVVCPPIGFEQLHAHRGLRHLSDQLARESLPTLRFDWDGTGDSAGDATDPDRLACWLDNVRAAVRWMKDQCGCRQVSVIGLRMGALLAALALEQDEIDNLILWSPVITGRSFVRELTVIDMTSATRPPGLAVGPATQSHIEAAGFTLSADTAGELSKVSLFKAQPNCRRILLAGRDDHPTDSRVPEHFAALGIHVEQQTWPGTAEMLVEPHRGHVPNIAIGGIAAWLNRQLIGDECKSKGDDNRDREQARHTPTGTSSSDAQAFQSEPALVDVGLGIRESACRISTAPDLFGILSEPLQRSNTDLPLIVLLNAGSAYRIGPGRMHVELARRLSSQGFRCLRLDLCGLGDSVVVVDDARENDSYASTVFRDIEITLQTLRERWGAQRIVLLGLCSGAYAAFQSAAQLHDPALVESILINPLTYFWREGMTLETAPTLELIREHYYLNSAWQPAKWWKLLSGRSHIGVRGAVRLVAQRLKLAVTRQPSAESTGRDNGHAGPSHPLTNDLTADLTRVASAKRQLTMFFATTDPGYSILTCQAVRQAKRMQRRGQLSVTFIEHADHTFSRRAPRTTLIDLLARHLCQRYLPK